MKADCMFTTSTHGCSGRGLDVCPTSNQLLGTVGGSDLQSPLKQFLEAGVPCTINSDDPLLFGCSLLGEYERCRRELKMSDEELAKCAAASFEHSRAPSALKQKGLEGIEARNKLGREEDLAF